MYVDYRVINIKNKFSNSDDVFNFAKQYFVELIKILKNNNIECASIDIAFNETNSVSSFEIEKYIPKDVLEKLPTEEDINLHLEIE